MTVQGMAVEIYKEALPALAASLVSDLVAGVVLGGVRAELRAAPGLLVFVPALLATRGNVYGSFDVHIVTALHQGLIEPYVTGDDEHLRAAATAVFANSVLTSAFAAVVAYFLLTFLGSRVTSFPILVGVVIVAGLLSGIAPTVVVVSVVSAGYRRGHNPDVIVGPVVTTTGDMFNVLSLLTAVRAVLAVAGVF